MRSGGDTGNKIIRKKKLLRLYTHSTFWAKSSVCNARNHSVRRLICRWQNHHIPVQLELFFTQLKVHQTWYSARFTSNRSFTQLGIKRGEPARCNKIITEKQQNECLVVCSLFRQKANAEFLQRITRQSATKRYSRKNETARSSNKYEESRILTGAARWGERRGAIP